MSQILKANQEREKIYTLHPEQLRYSIKFSDGQPTKIIIAKGQEHSLAKKRISECVMGCLNCVEPKCMKMKPHEIECASFPEMSHEMNDAVCPVDAIRVGAKSITIDKNKCIGCGLCAHRCPVGAIHFENGKATLNEVDSCPVFILSLDVTAGNIKKQQEMLKTLVPFAHSGSLCIENGIIMQKIYDKINRLSQDKQNLLARNLLIECGCECALSRKGDVYSRLDGFYENGNQMGALEIETGSDMLAVSRAILDDIAVLNSRFAITPHENHPLAVVLSLPNKRTDYWQVVKDIKAVLNISISTLTFGALLLFLWNGVEVNDFDQFYVDVDYSSIRRKVENKLERRVQIPDGMNGILENSK
ncbi:4Fe-4S binding protein [Lachnospiraceae bacterium HCP1S3_A8]